MKLTIDREADALYLSLDDSKVEESEEVAPGVVLDFNAENQVVGIEMLYLSKRTPKLDTEKLFVETMPESMLVREKPSEKYGK
jgi:uncharacterized protein YuzE